MGAVELRGHRWRAVSEVKWVSDTEREYRGVTFPWRGQEAMAEQMAAIDRGFARADLASGEAMAEQMPPIDAKYVRVGAVEPRATVTVAGGSMILHGDRLSHPDFWRELKASKMAAPMPMPGNSTMESPTRGAVEFSVHGTPQPQGSHRAPRAGVVISDNPRLRAWRSTIVKACPREFLAGPVSVSAVFRMPRPVSVPKSRKHPAVKPDLDKMLRALFDGITDAGLWEDDSRVVSVAASKRYAPPGEWPGVDVRVEQVE